MGALALALAVLAAGPALGQEQAPVQVQTLTAPDLFSAGAPDDDLPSDLWKGSSAALARKVIPQVASQPLSPAAAALARHVLGASASAPDGAGDDAELAGRRALALLALGDTDVVESITARTPSLSQKALLSQAAAEAALIKGEEDKACGIGDALAQGRGQVYWLRLRTFCQARAGQTAPAQLTLELANQQGRDPDFSRLMAAMLAGGDGGSPVLDNGLDFALSKRVASGWAQALVNAPAPIAVAAAKDAALPPDARLVAAARAARAGFIVPAAYDAAPLAPPTQAPVAAAPTAPPTGSAQDASAQDVSAQAAPATPTALDPLANLATANQPGAAGEGALVQIAAGANDMTLKEQALIELLKRARSWNEFQTLARLAEPGIKTLLAAQAVLREPVLFAQAAAAAGDAVSAKAARGQAGQLAPPPASIDLELLDALIAAASRKPDAATVQALDGELARPDGAGRDRAGKALALLAAEGAELGPQARLDLSGADLGALPAAGRLQALELSAGAGRTGDVALYVLSLVMDAGQDGLTPAARAEVVHALRQAGLKADAQAFAVEGLLGLQTRP